MSVRDGVGDGMREGVGQGGGRGARGGVGMLDLNFEILVVAAPGPKRYPEHPSPILHAPRDIISHKGKSLTPIYIYIHIIYL